MRERFEDMRRLSLLSFVAAAACHSPSSYCQAVLDTTCERLFACATGPERAALELQFADAAACSRAMGTRAQCADQTEASFCVSRKWNSSKAAVCLDELKATSCASLSTFRPTCAPPSQ